VRVRWLAREIEFHHHFGAGDGSAQFSPAWWDTLAESDLLDALGAAVTAFVALPDQRIAAMKPARGWTVPEIRTLILISYRTILTAVAIRSGDDLRGGIFDLQLQLDRDDYRAQAKGRKSRPRGRD
jgi:hypothetical protein